MFDDEYDLIQIDELDVIAETSEFIKEVSKISNQRLVEVVNEILLQLDFGKEAELAIGEYFRKGTISNRNRKVLEGTYILYYCQMALGVENGEIMVTSRK